MTEIITAILRRLLSAFCALFLLTCAYADDAVELRIDFSRTNDGVLDGVIVRVELQRLLAYVWGLSVVEWSIEDAPAGGCKYRFVHNGLADRGEGEEGLAAGWHEFLDRLDLHLDGRHISVDQQKATWERLKGPYLERLNAVLVPRRAAR